MTRKPRWILLAFALLATVTLRMPPGPGTLTTAQYCPFCPVADPFGQPCFYYGQPCGDGSCYCGFCGSEVACLQ